MELNREAVNRHLKTVEKSEKNKFRWQWLETTVEITLKGERKSIPLILLVFDNYCFDGHREDSNYLIIDV